MAKFNQEGYYVARVNGKWISFVSYEEYLDYLNDEEKHK